MTPAEIKKSNTSSVGAMRYDADKRQLAGLLMITGFCAVIFPLAGVAAAINGNMGTTVTEGLPFAGLFGGLCVVTVGVLSVLVGYLELVHDWGNKMVTGALLIFTQSA